MTHELIEQKEVKLVTIGGSKGIILPLSWQEKLKITEESTIRLRLAIGKHGTFFDGYKLEKE